MNIEIIFCIARKVPTTATKEQENLAIEYTKRILSNFDYYGVLTVEFFISEGKVIFNEIAPRSSQFGTYNDAKCY